MADADKQAKARAKDEAKTLACTARVRAASKQVFKPDGQRLQHFYVFFPPQSEKLPGTRTMQSAQHRFNTIVRQVREECNPPLDEDTQAARYTCGAVRVFQQYDSEERRNKIVARLERDGEESIGLEARCASERVQYGRFLEITVTQCYSQKDLNSFVDKLLRWHSENVQITKTRCPYPPVSLGLDVTLKPAITASLLKRGGKGIRDIIDSYDALRHFYIIEDPESLELSQYMAVSAEFKAIIDGQEEDGGFVEQIINRLDQAARARRH